MSLLLSLVLGGTAWAQTEEGPLVEEVFEGFGEAVEATVEPAGTPALIFWCSPYPLEQGWAVEVTRRWNRLHPQSPVQLRALPQDVVAEEVLRQAIRDGSTPDLTNHLFPSNVHEFAAAGGLMALETMPTLMAHLAERSGAEADRWFRSPDGSLYQFPWKNNPILMEYNLELFRAYGLAPPRTYSEFLAASRQLQSQTDGQVWMWAPSPTDKFWKRYYDFYTLYLAAAGGRGLFDEQGRPAFNDEAGVAVMRFLKELYQAGAAPREDLFPDDPDKLQALVNDRLATMMTGPWNIELTRDLGGEEVAFDFMAVPVPDEYPQTAPVWSYGNFRNFGIFRSCRRPELAAEFIAFATSSESDLAFLQAAQQLPFRQGLQSDPRFVAALQEGPAYLAKFALQSPWVRPVDNVPNLNKSLAVIADEFYQCAVLDKKTPEQAVADAARRVEELQREARRDPGA